MRISGGGLGRGYGGVQQEGHDRGHAGGGGEDASIENGEGGEESERSTSTTLTSAGGSAEVCSLYVHPLHCIVLYVQYLYLSIN